MHGDLLLQDRGAALGKGGLEPTACPCWVSLSLWFFHAIWLLPCLPFLCLFHLPECCREGSHSQDTYFSCTSSPSLSCFSSCFPWDTGEAPCTNSRTTCPLTLTDPKFTMAKSHLLSVPFSIAQPSSEWWDQDTLSLPPWGRMSCCPATCPLNTMLAPWRSGGSGTKSLRQCTTTAMERTCTGSRWGHMLGGQSWPEMVSLLEAWT